MSKSKKVVLTEREELEAFVDLLNTNESLALAQEAALRKKAKPFGEWADNLETSLVGWFCLQVVWVLALANLRDEALFAWLTLGLAQIALSFYWLDRILAWVKKSRRDWGASLSQAGLCISLEELMRHHPGEQLLRATVRPLYRADYLLAGYLAADVSRRAAQKRHDEEERALHELEAQACARLHSTLQAVAGTAAAQVNS